MKEDPSAIIPELALLAGAIGGLLVGMFSPRRRQWLVALLVAAAALAGIVAAGLDLARPARTVFEQSYAIDKVLGAGRLVVLVATLLTMLLAYEHVRGDKRETEFFVLLALAALGAVAMAGANDLLILMAGYLVASVPLYALTGFRKDALGTEAALKYYLMGALLGIVMLSGITVLLGAGGSTAYEVLHQSLAGAPRGVVAVGAVAVLAGLLFKIGAVPGHFWVPDVTEGAPAPVAAFVTTVPKIGGLLAADRLFAVALPAARVDWPLLLAVVAAVTMTLGNLAAFFQDSARRLLAYSTVSQVGYLLIAVAVVGRSDLSQRGLLFYLAAYAVTNLGAFAVVAELPAARTLRDYGGLFRRRPALALCLVVCLLGFIGTPPTGVFVGKLTVFSAAVDGRLVWLAVLAIVNTVASVFYYLRWIAPLFLAGPTPAPAPAPAGRWTLAAVYAATTLALVLGLLGGPGLALTRGAPLGG
jgi:NADH-quinone oxidoreductase subunit N